jgi:hypothetical protein
MSQHPFQLLLIFSLASGVPDMATLRSEFRSAESSQQGPLFRGYCGEHESEYQGITQLARTLPGEFVIAVIHLLNSQPL